jgi:hypothetical protein
VGWHDDQAFAIPSANPTPSEEEEEDS